MYLLYHLNLLTNASKFLYITVPRIQAPLIAVDMTGFMHKYPC